ncbi:transcriptional regulator, partial [Vibrio sp. V23_P3S9T160]|nr:transcriptional regulator [Vibrio sp. V23_P3S9T160]
SADDESNNKINNYIDKEFQNIDRETFKQQLRDAMKNITADYETGLKKGRKVSVNRPIDGAPAPKRLR